MQIGMNIRNWGPHATPDNLAACAELADQSTLDAIWLNDHIGFPAGDWHNEYGVDNDMGAILDPLGVATFLAGITSRISFGTAVLVVPYRSALLTAKWLATIQVLSKNRFLFGLGAGYLAEEFKAVGVPRNQRGKVTDETLEFLRGAFANERVEVNGQALILLPRPAPPPFLIGGVPAVAIPRAVRFGDGWMPVGMLPEDLVPHIKHLDQAAADAGREKLQVFAMKTLPLKEPARAIELAQAFRDVGVTHLVHAEAYSNPSEYQEILDQLSQEIRPAVVN